MVGKPILYMNEATIEEKVKDLVASQTQIKIEKISLKTELGKDLGVDGDDAAELLEKFSEEFQVDMTTFQFNKYFGYEAGANPVLWLASVIFRIPIARLEPLTVQDLVDAAKAKKWLH